MSGCLDRARFVPANAAIHALHATARSMLRDRSMDRLERMRGLLLGMAVGDALGLPREGLCRARARRLYGDRLEHRFFFGRGLASDDTELACITAQALLASRDVDGFVCSLSWRLRGWLLGGPAAIGWGTLRSLVRLTLGVPPHRSGVRSAGNGAAIRAPVLGACAPDLDAYVRASTRITHADPRALAGALAIAIAARHAMRGAPDRAAVLAELRSAIDDPELLTAFDRIDAHLERGSSPEVLADALGCENGVSGYVHHTVPICLFAWLRGTDFRRTLEDVIALGGDTDTVAAITGALAGATSGAAAIPNEWRDRFADWPRSTAFLEELARRLAHDLPDDIAPPTAPSPHGAEGREKGGSSAREREGPVHLFWPALPLRNLVFFAIAFATVARRFLPPY
jgi:ADP-ribosyl-[dinitrogen reductase] hydrolase